MAFNRLNRRLLLSALALQAAGCESGTCITPFNKCGGSSFNVSGSCCDEDSHCVVKNFWFAQCLTEEWAAIKVAQGWDGSVLDCEEMPRDVAGGPLDSTAAAPVPEESGKDTDCDGECMGVFEQCGGGYNTSAVCCDPEADCVIKNWFYAQCLTKSYRAVYIEESKNWDGRVLQCAQMPDDAPRGPDFWNHDPLTVAEVNEVSLSEAPDLDVGVPAPAPTPSPTDPSEGPDTAEAVPVKPVPVPSPPAVVVPEPHPLEEPVSQPPEDEEAVPEPQDPVEAPTEEPIQEPEEPAEEPEEPEEPSEEPDEASEEPEEPEEPTEEPAEEPDEEPEEPVEEPDDSTEEPEDSAEEPEEPATATPAPVDTSEPSQPEPTPQGEFEFSGDLTYYGGAGVAGHCTQDYVPEGYTTVALNAPQYAGGSMCGMCVYACFDNLELGQGERCFEAIVDDECPECLEGDLDLGENGSGRWPLEWMTIQCPEAPDGLIFSTQGSNPWYAKVKAQGGPSSVESMTCNGLPGFLTPDAFFEFLSSTGDFACGMVCEVVYSNGFGTGSGKVTASQIGGKCN